MKTIVLFTASYPFSEKGEYTFLEPELELLTKQFNVVIIPLSKQTKDARKFIKQFSNIKVIDVDLFIKTKKELWKVWKYDIGFFKELVYVKNFKHLKKLFYFYFNMLNIKNYVEQLLNSKIISKEDLFYTFWFNYATSALIRLKSKHKVNKVITRVHGGDLYYERQDGYIPFRKYDIKYIDNIIAVSDDGYRYIKDVYKSSKGSLHHLLSKDYGIINPYKCTQEFNFVSCSMAIKLKRVDKIIKYLNFFSHKYKIKTNFTYIGDGVDLPNLIQLVKNTKNSYLSVKFVGYKELNEIMQLYKSISYDYFIFFSETEGGVPFALREAASCEIPLICTNVGGIPEVIDDNGFLIDKDLDKDEVMRVLLKAYELKFTDIYLNMRKKSRELFLEKFELYQNYKPYIKFLKGLQKC